MMKRKVAQNEPNTQQQANNCSQQTGNKKRQKVNSATSTTNSKRQTVASKKQSVNSQQQVNNQQTAQGRQDEEPVWIYGLINNIEQMLSQFNAASNSQRLQQVVQQQQQLFSSASKSSQVVKSASSGKANAARSRSSTSSSGYSTPSSLYSSASLSPPFSNSSATTSNSSCAYSLSSSSNSLISTAALAANNAQSQSIPKQQTAAQTTASNSKTNQQQQQQQQQLPRSPISRQIKFHEYKGPPQTRRPTNPQKQQQQQLVTAQSKTTPTTTTKNIATQEPSDCVVASPQLVKVSNCNSSPSGSGPRNVIVRPMTSLCQPVQSTLMTTTRQTIFASSTPTDQQLQAPCKLAANQRQQQKQPALMTGQPHSNNRLVVGPDSLDSRAQVMVVRQHQQLQASNQSRLNQQTPNYINNNQHLSLQLIRTPDGGQQQVLVLDPAAFQQMQQQQQQQQNQQQNLVVLQQQPQEHQHQQQLRLLPNEDSMQQHLLHDQQHPSNAYNTLINNTDDNNFQMHHSQEGRVFKDQQQNGGAMYTLESGGQACAPPMAYQQQARTISEGTAAILGNGVPEYQNQEAAEFVNDPNNNKNPQYLTTAHTYISQADQEELCRNVAELEDDTCEIEPTISFDSDDMDHGVMFSEFIDFQDIPLNVDESDWLRKFLPPCPH